MAQSCRSLFDKQRKQETEGQNPEDETKFQYTKLGGSALPSLATTSALSIPPKKNRLASTMAPTTTDFSKAEPSQPVMEAKSRTPATGAASEDTPYKRKGLTVSSKANKDWLDEMHEKDVPSAW